MADCARSGADVAVMEGDDFQGVFDSSITIWKEDGRAVLRCNVDIFQSDLLELPPVDLMKCRAWLTGVDDKTPSEILFELANVFKILEHNQRGGTGGDANDQPATPPKASRE